MSSALFLSPCHVQCLSNLSAETVELGLTASIFRMKDATLKKVSPNTFHATIGSHTFTVCIHIVQNAHEEIEIFIDSPRSSSDGFAHAEFFRALRTQLILANVLPLPVLLSPDEARAKQVAEQKAWKEKARAKLAEMNAKLKNEFENEK